ncbi:hypothetical protein ACFU99_03390 [Streptomyces sp. NPDC057654]|uniref:hypothetical protein n=1 Tax=Streptomyces sp. NPDC057654 TaxID=3346196 RepID=UPI0036859A7D
MKRKTWVIVGVAVLAIGGITSLFKDDEPSKPAADSKPSATASARPTADHRVKPSKTPTSGIPSPDAAQRESLIRALRAIEPGLVAKEDRAVSRARDTCLDHKSGKDAAMVQKNTKSRFEGGTVPSLDDDQAAGIVSAVKESFCG